MTQNQYIPINTTSPTLSLKAAQGTDTLLSAQMEWVMVEFGSLERPGETEAGRCGSKRDSSTENKPAWGGKTSTWEEEKEEEKGKQLERVQRETGREKGSACVCSGLKTAQFPDAHLLRWNSCVDMRVSRRGTILAWPSYYETREESWDGRVRFGGEDWNNFARWCVCHIISSYSGFITQLRRHFTVCDSKILLYDMMKVLTDHALRRSFTARDESNCAVAFLACIFTMRTCEKKKPPPSLTLRALAGKDRHFLDFMHHVNTAYGSSILRLLYSNSRIMLPWVTRCEMRRNVSETWSVPAFNFLTGWWN